MLNLFRNIYYSCTSDKLAPGEQVENNKKKSQGFDSLQTSREMANENTPSEMDRTEAAPLTSERRYGVFRTGLAAALILIVVLAGAGIALLFGIRDGRILLGILLPLMLLSATIANLWFWWLHRKAAKRREHAANEWVSTTLTRQATLINTNQSNADDSTDLRYEKLSQKSSLRHTPPPGYHIVEQTN